MKHKVILVLLVLFLGCDDKDPAPGSSSDTQVFFEDTRFSFAEGTLDNSIGLRFSKVLTENGSITISVSSPSAVYGTNYTTTPAVVSDVVVLDVSTGSVDAEVLLEALEDMDLGTDEITLEIISVEGGLAIGGTKSTVVSILDDAPVNEAYRDCLIATSADRLEVATWNIKFFPQSSTTRDVLVDLVNNMDIDIIAVQEISNTSQFLSMANQIPGWEAAVENVFGDIELGYLYKTSEITSFGAMTKLFPGDGYGYPREAVEVDIVHTSGLAVKLINVHLKCCGDSEDRRADASATMKSYLDKDHADGNVIVLGDFNDDIVAESPFTNFIEDSGDCFFADQAIADGSDFNWSFPGFPSHIDHILCTNELADNLETVSTLLLKNCVTNYESVISDHLPLVAVFSN